MLDEVDPYLEAAVLWLAQTILENLLTGKLEAWIRQVGLADDIDKLKSEVERVEMVAAAVKGRAIGNKPLARSLARLKELLYDADDVVDELDYYRLQQQVEGGRVTWDDPEGMQAAELADEGLRGSAVEDIPRGSGGSLRSKLWKDFEIIKWDNGKAIEAKCIHCGASPIKCGSSNGTSVLKNHLRSKGCIRKRGASDQPPNHSSTVDVTTNAPPVVIDYTASRKRRRPDEGTAQTTTANTHTPWDKAKLSSRIQKITSQLQDNGGEVSDFLKILGPGSVASSNHCPSDQRLRTSSLIQRKMYGRAKEKAYIIKLMTDHKSGGLTVLPIVGIGGVGKTALAQLVYNDPAVESQFDFRIWVWVSSNFDETRLSIEMLDFVPQETCKGLCSFAKPQEVLKSHIKSKRVLLVLDDVWDEVNDCWWNQLLSPLKYENANGNVILMTTRQFSVAKRLGTGRPVKLGALEHGDFWLLFKQCAFGDENYEGHESLSIIGRKIAEKLKGNPLAAVTAGALLRDDPTIDRWSSILKNEDWKSLQLSGGLMPAFKLSYDQLPYHLQLCFSYCSIFPYNHQFLGEELVGIWISQGFVKCNHSSQRLEEIGRCFLTDLVNLGFFNHVKEKEDCYAMCGFMHDFARMVSRNECATIDGLQYNKILPTVRHLAVVTDSVYSKDQHGNIPRNTDFEENLRNLRTLVLIGQYDYFFFQSFQDIFQKAPNLRLLQMSATHSDFNPSLCSLVNPTHLRYINLKANVKYRHLPEDLSKLYHLQVLDVGSYTKLPTIPNCMDNLVSLRHLVAHKGVYSSIASIGNMTSLLELHDFKIQNCSSFEITQLQSMKELVQLGVSQLENVQTWEETYKAGLRNKRHLEKLHLSWSTYDSVPGLFDDSGQQSVFESLEPHPNLKHLQISGYKGTTSPIWLSSNISVTSLQTLHLMNCGEWEILPPLERLPFLTKLELRKMPKVIEVWVPSLEVLILYDMLKLEKCSCTSVGHLNSSLRVLDICMCPALKVFDLLENDHKMYLTRLSVQEGANSRSNKSSSSALTSSTPDELLDIPLNPISCPKKISVAYCPCLKFNVSKKGLSGFTLVEELAICRCPQLFSFLVHEDRDDNWANGRWLLPQSLRQLHISDASLETLNLHSCTALEDLVICNCVSLVTLEGWKSLVSLTHLKIYSCPSVPPWLEHLSMQGLELCPRLSLLETLIGYDTSLLTTSFCKHLRSLRCLRLSVCDRETTRLTDEQEMALLLLTSLQDLQFYECGKLVDFPVGLHSLPSLKRLEIDSCNGISVLHEMGLPTSLQELQFEHCERLLDLPAGLHRLPSLERLCICECNWILRLPVMGLPGSLEELDIFDCSQELTDECRKLATRKLKVIIDGEYIN